MTINRELTPRAEKRRKEVIAAALRVFSKVGYANAKIDDVSEESGAAKGTVYLYFDGKEELFKAVLRETMLPVLEEVEGMVFEPNASAADRLRAQFEFFYSRVMKEERRQVMRLVIAEGPNFPEVKEFYFNTILLRALTAIRATIDFGIERGEFRKPEGEFYTKAVMGSAILASVWKTVFDDFLPLDTEAFAQTHIDLVLNGLRVRE
ncbi:MAG: TetR/AcrR family transcriptional regulator [Erythrobacter sp.]|nr:TetR/AcrR family transcriptional regulator [Erythrobacter sp.]